MVAQGVGARLTSDVLDTIFEAAVAKAVLETSLPRIVFPITRSYELSDLLGSSNTNRADKAH